MALEFGGRGKSQGEKETLTEYLIAMVRDVDGMEDPTVILVLRCGLKVSMYTTS